MSVIESDCFSKFIDMNTDCQKRINNLYLMKMKIYEMYAKTIITFNSKINNNFAVAIFVQNVLFVVWEYALAL